MSDKRWLHAVPVRVQGDRVTLRAESGGGYWVTKYGGDEVPFDDLDTQPNDRDAWRECAVKLAGALGAYVPSPCGGRCGSLSCEALATFDKLKEK